MNYNYRQLIKLSKEEALFKEFKLPNIMEILTWIIKTCVYKQKPNKWNMNLFPKIPYLRTDKNTWLQWCRKITQHDSATGGYGEKWDK